jgi:hypothetical protein
VPSSGGAMESFTISNDFIPEDMVSWSVSQTKEMTKKIVNRLLERGVPDKQMYLLRYLE